MSYGAGLDFVRALGIKVVDVEDLGPDARHIPSLRLILMEAALSEERREEVYDYFLPGLFKKLDS